MSSVRRALAALLPDATEGLFLKACLSSGEACGHAWEEFLRRSPSLQQIFRTDREELKRLAPLLLSNLSRNGVHVESELQTILRTALFREQLRSKRYQEVLAESLRVLAGAGIEVVVMRGAALSNSVYREPALRHSHDIDFLIPADDRPGAVRALLDNGFTGTPLGADTTREQRQLIHPNGLPLRLDVAASQTCLDDHRTQELWDRSVSATIAGESARRLAPEDNLALVLSGAAWSSDRDLRWACDGWMIAAACPSLSADILTLAMATHGLVLSSVVLLEYLADLGAPVAKEVVASARHAAAAATVMQRDLALFGLRRGKSGGLRSVVKRIPDYRARFALLFWVLFPSLAYLRWAYRPRYAALTPAWYVIRVVASIGD